MTRQASSRKIRLGGSVLEGARLPAAFALCVALTTACSLNSQAERAAPAASGGTGGSAGTGGNTAEPTSLTFESTEALTLFPGELRTVTVLASPPGVHRIRLALLGEAKDASLDRSEVDTLPDGTASVELTAPTSPTTFSIRASSGSTASAQIPVSVSDSGFVVLQVEPSYSGTREVSYWVASVRAGTTCAALSGNPPPDGDLIGNARAGSSPQIEGVPVGPALAVTLRAGSFAGGCTDVSRVLTGQVNRVTVTVIDRPLQMSETNLAVALGIDTTSFDWTSSLQDGIDKATTAMLGSAPDCMTALLDVMRATAGDADAFTAARSAGAWDEALRTALGTEPLAILASEWLTTGAAALNGPNVFAGQLVSAGKDTDLAKLALSTVAGVDARLAGFPAVEIQGSWTADAGDTVVFGTRLYWTPSLLLTALALDAARTAVPGTTTVADALAEQLSCPDVGTLLSEAGAAPGVAFEGCDTACVTELCTSAVAILWERARNASQTGAASLHVALTGKAAINDSAQPIGFTGSWVGSLQAGATSASVSGPAVGSVPPPPN
jgi:hypothetical protein